MSLMKLLPEYYKGSSQVVEMQGSFGHWTDTLLEAKKDLFSQMSATTATWGLSTWEKALGIEGDVSRPYQFRRERVMSKLRGAGTTTKAMIQNVAESFSNGEVAILEYNDECRFDVKFVGTIGVPPNMQDLTKAIEEIKPAHLACSYMYIYNTYGDLHNLTYGELERYTYDQLRNEVMN